MFNPQRGFHTYYVYIITNRYKSVLYTGLTNNLKLRLSQHQEKMHPDSFSSRYNVQHLIYYEKFTWIQEAIAREKEIKNWNREKKVALIRSFNAEMRFLEEGFM